MRTTRRAGWVAGAAFALALVVLVALAWGAVLFFEARGIHPTLTLARLAMGLAGLAALLSPLVWLESWSERRYARIAAALREARPGAAVSERPEGLAFASEGATELLLRPAHPLAPPLLVLADGRRVEARAPGDIPPAVPVAPVDVRPMP